MARQERNDRTSNNVPDGQPREDTKQETNFTRSRSADMNSEEGPPPPLPPRPKTIDLLNERPSTSSSSLQRSVSSNQSLPLQATTAVSLTDVNTQSFQDGTREVYASSAGRVFAGLKLRSKGSSNQLRNGKGSDTADSMSVRSYALNSEPAAETESLFGDMLGTGQDNPQLDIRLSEEAAQRVLNVPTIEVDDTALDFEKEFSPVGELDSDGRNEEALLDSWKSKQKHFLILSAAGKPIYTRHGDDGVISSYIGILQTIISFYQGSDDPLKSFSAGETKFVVLSKGPLHLVAVSRLVENNAQLRLQLDALYMQILSTLTLPTLTHLFSIRPSTDLRRPLQGTETLLSSLADSFTRGSPPTLLSALECLKIRKGHRAVINNSLLKCRVDALLYGLVVAGGRLVSVVRPKRHSLHPGDLQLIFNMVFEADGVKAGGGEPWIPICLPGFNNKGYLYMYVSFLELQEDKVKEINPNEETTAIKDDAVAILLISAKKESFFDLQKMKNSVVESLQKNGSMAVIKAAIQRGRPVTTDIIPGTVLRHFLYKSKANVQFTLPSYEPYYSTIPDRRRLLSIYHVLHASVHAKNAHLKVNHCISRSTTSLAWVTPMFELYCVAGPNTSRSALAQSANKIVQWVQREEERLFIIGGAVSSIFYL